MTDLYQPSLFADIANYSTSAGLERFESSAWQVDDLFENVPFHIAGTVLEPASGNGAIAEPLKRRGLHVITNDSDPRGEADTHFDACAPNAEFPLVDWCITNPPFSLAVSVLLNVLPRVRLGVIFQLRITFSEPTIERDRLFQTYKPNGQITLQRFSFTGNGSTDSTTTAWFCWLVGNPPLFAPMRDGKKLVQWPGYAVFSKRSEFFRIARRHS